MSTLSYTAKVQKNGSLTLPREASEALKLQPGDEITIAVDSDAIEQEREELRQALDIGLGQLERGEYSAYTADTIHELVTEVQKEGRKRLGQARQKHAL
jgi:bifunctional DNA-binding transcriptional regulator/antitoxin component of YhaV-PrlF toxin-antitoxin module